LAAPAAVVAAPVVERPVLAVVDLAHLPVLALAQVVALRARRAHRLQLLLRARPLVKAHLPVPAQVVAGLAHLVVEPAVPLQLLLLSLQSFSAAMARNTP
jgi:hypothetical protein